MVVVEVLLLHRSPGDVNIHGCAENTGAWMELLPMPNM